MISTKFFLKKSILVLLIFSFAFISCDKDDDDDPDTATFIVTRPDSGNSTVTDNQTISFSTVDLNAKLHLEIKNQSSNEITIQIRLISMTNSDGTLFENCVNNCFPNIAIGNIDTSFVIAAGGTKANISMWNKNNTGVTPKTFNFEIAEVGGSGESLNFSYVYNP